MEAEEIPKAAGATHPIDAFIQRKLRDAGLDPAPPANRRTLIRRVTFDLTGLPPTPGEIDAFISDRSEKAWEKVIDRLLDSPRYGEQWARHWLDVARYADTAGFSNDFERPHAWRYRDYVIRSFNDDKPFNRFIVEQIAGDELALSKARGPDAANPELLVATSFLRMGPWEHTGMSVAAVTRQRFLDDVTRNTSAAFLGITLRCARCHDHKFDPIPQVDYYRFLAVFAPTQLVERPAPFLPEENTAGFGERRKTLDRRLKEHGYVPVDRFSKEDPQAKKILRKLNRKRQQTLERERRRTEPSAMSVYNGPLNGYNSPRPLLRVPANVKGKPQEIRVLLGGALQSTGEKVAPGVLQAIRRLKARIPETTEGRRLALARWIASPDHPLTARVIANRIWQHHFGGKGIVATPSNFGKMGKRPTHPKLLGWLALQFVGDGASTPFGMNWSIKKLHRLILTSRAYRRGRTAPDLDRLRTIDPSNDLLSVYPPRRLAAEEIRDSALAVSGELSPKRGGPGIFPEINWEVALQPRHVMGGLAPAYQPSRLPEERNRRTIYAFRRRSLDDPMLEVFNRPPSELSCERRDQTTVTPQVFALFNSGFSHDRALAFARRLEKEADTPEDRIDLAFRLAFGRPSTAAERTRCLRHLAEMTGYHRRHVPEPVDLPTVARREMVEELNGKVMLWDETLDLMKDYQRDLKPWDVRPETRALAEVCLVVLNSNEFLYVR